jgi:hypothetical protein
MVFIDILRRGSRRQSVQYRIVSDSIFSSSNPHHSAKHPTWHDHYSAKDRRIVTKSDHADRLAWALESCRSIALGIATMGG